MKALRELVKLMEDEADFDVIRDRSREMMEAADRRLSMDRAVDNVEAVQTERLWCGQVLGVAVKAGWIDGLKREVLRDVAALLRRRFG